MKGFFANIEEKTLNNNNFRQVLFTGQHCQLVVMSLLPNEEIGMEVHQNVDQFFRIEQGTAEFTIDGEKTQANASDVVIVPAGAQHNVTNVSSNPLKLYTIYSPPNHPDGTVHRTKQDAEAAEAASHQ